MYFCNVLVSTLGISVVNIFQPEKNVSKVEFSDHHDARLDQRQPGVPELSLHGTAKTIMAGGKTHKMNQILRTEHQMRNLRASGANNPMP